MESWVEIFLICANCEYQNQNQTQLPMFFLCEWNVFWSRKRVCPRNVYFYHSSLLRFAFAASRPTADVRRLCCVNHFRKAICSDTVTRKACDKKLLLEECASIVSSALSGTESDSVLTESIKFDIMSLRRTLFFRCLAIFTHCHGWKSADISI